MPFYSDPDNYKLLQIFIFPLAIVQWKNLPPSAVLSYIHRPIKNKYNMHGQDIDSIDHARYFGVNISSDIVLIIFSYSGPSGILGSDGKQNTA